MYYAEACNDLTNGGDHLLSLAPGQHSSKETSQRWRVVGYTVSDLTDPGFVPQTSLTDSIVLATELTVVLVHMNGLYCNSLLVD